MVELTNEDSLLHEIDNLSASGKIQDSVALTTQTNGSKLTAQEAETKIQKMLPTTRQRINAAKFYLDAIENMNYASHLGGQPSMFEDQKPFIDFSDSDLQVQINLLNSEPFPLVVFVVLNGFFSNLVSLEDCVAKIINIVYDLLQDDSYSSKIGQELGNKIPSGNLTTHLHAFRAIGQDGKPNPTGSPFNVSREIRHQLIHDDIDGVMVSFASLSLSGSASAPKLHFHHSFFSANTTPATTEMITFCKDVYQKTVDFVDECYRLIRDNLQHSGVLPI